MRDEPDRQMPDPSRVNGRREQRLEALAEEMSRVVESAGPERRAELREYATELMRAETEGIADAVPPPPRTGRPAGPLAFAVLLGLVGLFFLLLLPPVGIVLLLAAVPLGVWGVLKRPETPSRGGSGG